MRYGLSYGINFPVFAHETTIPQHFSKESPLGTLSVMTLILAGNIPLADDVNAESLPPVTGQCGSSNGGTFPSQPTTNLCSAGIQNWIDNNASDGTYNWECLGSGGGSTTTCSATKRHFHHHHHLKLVRLEIVI